MRGAGLLVGAGLVLAAGGAHAQEFFRTRVPASEVCLAWRAREFRFHVDAAGSARTPGSSEFFAIQAALQTWQTLSDGCSDFRLVEDVPLLAPPVGYVEDGDNQNVLVFREQACEEVAPPEDTCWLAEDCANRYGCWEHAAGTIALTTTTYGVESGTILDADIEMNAAGSVEGTGFLFTTVSSPPCTPEAMGTDCVATDVQNTLTHELGHVLGFDHVEREDSTMAPTAPLGETRKRILDSGTSRGFCQSYPRGLPATGCDAIVPLQREVRAVSRGTPGPGGCHALPAPALWPALLLPVLLWPLPGRRRKAARRAGEGA